MLILIGSQALNFHHNIRSDAQYDMIGSLEEVKEFKSSLKDIIGSFPLGKIQKIKTKKHTYNISIVKENTTNEELIKIVQNDKNSIIHNGMLVPSLDVLYLLKMSHRYLKNSPNFVKTMEDILFMREKGANIPEEYKDFYKSRQKETYNYGHPKLKVNKDDFFSGDGIDYIYDHDTIHESTKSMPKPAYTYFKPDEEDVYCSKDMFFAIDEKIRLSAVFEETQVLAIERSQVPFGDRVDPKRSFDIALIKVCSSITSGWFREFAWENYHKVQNMYNPNYVNKFWEDVENGIVKKLSTKTKYKMS